MKSYFIKIILSVVCLTSICLTIKAQTSVPLQMNPWKQDQLMEPEILASMINASAHPVIYNIGVVQNIKGAIQIGAASGSENLDKLKASVKNLPKNSQIIIYCGCCPMGKCPNIRPAFNLLSNMKFTNVSVLDLPVNLKTDWIGKGFPIE